MTWRYKDVDILKYLAALLLCITAPLNAETLVRTSLGSHFSEKDVQLDTRDIPSRNVTLIIRDLFEPLIRLNGRGEIIGGTAESLNLSPDGMVWTIKLGRNWRWSDGAPLTAHDYVYGFTSKLGTSNEDTGVLGSVVGKGVGDDRPVGIKAIDERTFTMTLTKPFAWRRINFAVYLYPLPSHVAPEGEVYWSNWEQRPSTGRFKLSRIEGSSVYLERNAHYPNNDPRGFDKVVHHSLSWEQAAPRFVDGELDLILNVPQNQFDFFTEENSNITPQDLITNYYYLLNHNDSRLTDLRVKKALSMAVDRDELVSLMVGDEYGSVAFEFAPNMTADASSNSLPDSLAALQEARSLMEQAGYSETNPLKITLSGHGSTFNKRMANLISTSWNEIHVEIDMDFEENNISKWFKRVESGNYELATMRRTPSSTVFFDYVLPCYTQDNPFCGFYVSPDFVQVFSAALKETDYDKQMEKTKHARDYFNSQVPLIPLFRYHNPVVLSSRLCMKDENRREQLPVSGNFLPTKSGDSICSSL